MHPMNNEIYLPEFPPVIRNVLLTRLMEALLAIVSQNRNDVRYTKLFLLGRSCRHLTP